jgi:hypothetical protein
MRKFVEWGWEKRVFKARIAIRNFQSNHFPGLLHLPKIHFYFWLGLAVLYLASLVIWNGKRHLRTDKLSTPIKVREIKIDAKNPKYICGS